jgi:GNAT superfamily N-acetyltransferase
MFEIRSFKPADLDALYEISLATGHEGSDASHFYSDGMLMGHVYAAPYALLEPSLALVVEDERGVAGFALGTPDTDYWADRLENEWWPNLRTVYDDPGNIPASSWSADQQRAFMIHHPVRTPQWITERYPAHLHLNLLARLQGRGIGRLIFSEWIGRAARRGVGPVHVGVNRFNSRAITFWSRQDFSSLLSADGASERTVWMGRH